MYVCMYHECMYVCHIYMCTCTCMYIHTSRQHTNKTMFLFNCCVIVHASYFTAKHPTHAITACTTRQHQWHTHTHAHARTRTPHTSLEYNNESLHFRGRGRM